MKTLTILAGLTFLTAVSFAQSVKIDAYTKSALLSGLDEERKAEATYRTAIDTFGAIRPFTNLVPAEVQHQNTIIKLMKTYGVAVPANPYIGTTIEIPTVFSEACLAFADFERLEAATYKTRAAKVNVKNVASAFLQLAKVSEENHAVALEKAAASNCVAQVCDGTGPKGNGGKGKGKGGASLDGVQTCAAPIPQGQGSALCDGKGPHGNGTGICDGSGPHGKGQCKGQGQGKGQGKGQGRGKGQCNGQGKCQGNGRGRN